MATQHYLRLFFYSWKLVVGTTLLGGLLALGVSLLQPLRYSSVERILITQTNAAGLDPYTALKSTERIAQNLSELIYTSSFFNAVMAKSQIDPSYFPFDEAAKRRKWRDTISTEVSAGTGIMAITAYHTSRDKAIELSIRTAQELVNITPNYFGYAVRVQIIDDPLSSSFYAKPDFLKNTILGLIAGFLLGTAWALGKQRYS
ncbi:hypothetical protein IT408_01170 [Candidatus Uhrbacteria bacterium]|nr:hypothetical protein [Candidatus Uhrbacteria bacterium]